ncbi:MULTISPECIES: BTAD domain-containing putative transcriptional regulator [Streptomyces]|uniref:BTAD domain-containing putative transcriptional regulator n=1 Tax=Streptomyces TaxID=1883 RepID=UPI001E5EC517|nr:BTAD domain-containing putative transcriptional regulator [Streptomyces ruber]
MGPLEVHTGSGPLELGGTRQRAALAFLLLHANRVVPTSHLLGALWPVDDAPVTARKILQNAVWRLRRTLADAAASEDGADTGAPELLTRAPGYLLRVRPEQVDLLVFQQQVAAGRAALAAGDPLTASRALRDALSLWRGLALADLVEDGTAWPQLTALQDRRLDVMEDRFEAELACGGHHAVLRELEAFVEAEPLRERASRQLMTALYRCGRQAEALDVYNRLRTALFEGLGLEPGHRMRTLQQSVLTHDPSLDLPSSPPAEPASPPEHPPGASDDVPVPAPSAGPGPATGTPAAAPPEDAPRRPGDTPAEPPALRQPGSVLMFRFRLGAEFDRLPPQDVDQVLDALSRLVRETIEDSGGRATSVGSVQLGFFADSARRGHGAGPAVRAAVAVRDRLTAPAAARAPSAGPAPLVPGLGVHAAVTTGEAVVTELTVAGTVRPLMGGELVERCQDALEPTAAHEIRVCDRTRRLTEPWVTYQPVPASPSHWRVGTTADDGVIAPPGGHGGELDLMRGLLRRARDLGAPHLVTVLGPSGAGTARLLTGFRDALAAEEDGVRVLSATVPPPGHGGPLAAPAEMFAAYCGTTARDTPDTALRGAEAALLRLTGHADHARPLLSLLRPLVTPGSGATDAAHVRRTLLAWRDFVVRVACAQPLVLVWDGLHHADDLLLDTVEQLTEHRDGVPLLNVVGTRPLLVERRPDWAGGRRHAVTVSLPPTGLGALDRLLAPLLIQDGGAEVA